MLIAWAKPGSLRRCVAASVVMGAMSAEATRADAQASRSVVRGATCRTCRIELDKSVTLRPPKGQAGYSMWSRVVRDSKGQIYVANEGQSDMEVYDSTGVYLKSIGRRGQGPGEYGVISSLSVLPGDTLLVGDRVNRRLTLVSPAGRAVRTTPFQFSTRRLIPRPGNGYLANATINTPDQIGLPLHMIDSEGVITKSFGVDTAIYRPDLAIMHSRPIAFFGATLWTSYASQYVLEAFDTSGRRVTVIERKADWFKPWIRNQVPSPAVPPNPAVHELHADGRHLWVLLNRPGNRWRDAVVPVPGAAPTRYSIDRVDLYYNTTIEVFEPRSRQLLASRSLPQLVLGFADSTHVVIYREGDDGTPYFDLRRIHLQRTEND
jgi:hypothetical protein